MTCTEKLDLAIRRYRFEDSTGVPGYHSMKKKKTTRHVDDNEEEEEDNVQLIGSQDTTHGETQPSALPTHGSNAAKSFFWRRSASSAEDPSSATSTTRSPSTFLRELEARNRRAAAVPTVAESFTFWYFTTDA